MKKSRYSQDICLNFVLSFAMVCTLLAGFNVVAFAADDDLSDTVSVQKFYYDVDKGGNGEHIYTIDESEISYYKGEAAWNDEGTAWTAPVSSKTPVYRVANYNTGEHLWITDKGYVDYLVGLGWTQEQGIAFYSDDNMGVPVYRLWDGTDRVGSHHFSTNAEEIAWLVSIGWKNEGPQFYGVKEEATDIVLVDENGLQSDGSGLVGDTLSFVIPGTVGVPDQIVWYVDGVVAAKTEFNTIDDCTINAALEGTWSVAVSNKNGDIFTSNSIKIVDKEIAATITDYTVNDNYETIALANQVKDDAPEAATLLLGMGPEIDTATGNAVVTFTMDKVYDGTFYLFDVEEEVPVGVFAVGENEEGVITVEANDTAAQTALKTKLGFTDSALAFAVVNNMAGDVVGIKQTAKDGSTSYKLTASAFTDAELTRGNHYVLVYAQDSDEDFDITDPETWNATSPQEAPYVMAPDAVKVTDIQETAGTAGWTAQLTTRGIDASWINGVCSDDIEIVLYSNVANTTTDGVEFTDNLENLAVAGKFANLTADGAKATGEAADDGYVYATFYSPEGIFGDEELEFVSQVVEPAPVVANDVNIEYNALTAKNDIKVSFDNLKDDSTVVLTTVKKAFDDAGNLVLDPTKPATYVGIMTAEKGDQSVTFKNVVTSSKTSYDSDDPAAEDTYFVVVVPNTSAYTKWAPNVLAPTPGDLAVVERVPGKLALDGSGAMKASTGGTIEFTAKKPAKMVVYDQFGKKVEGDAYESTTEAGMAALGFAGGVVLKGTTDQVQSLPGAPKVTVNLDGSIEVVFVDVDGDIISDDIPVTAGFTWKYTTMYGTMTLTCAKSGIVHSDDEVANAAEFTLTFN